MTINKTNFTEDFIRKYKAALSAKLSKEQFSQILGIKPDSMMRRRLAISKEKGLNLPFLPDSNFPITQSQQDRYNTYMLDSAPMAEQSGINIKNKKIFVIAAAQNATPIHENFVAAIKNYCDVRNAEFIVIPYRYKNPTSVWSQNNENDEWWAPGIAGNICNSDLKLCKRVRLMGHIHIQPTASEPLSGFDSFTGLDSAIFGHPKIQLKTVATPSQSLPKILTSTGACTVPNYTDSKAGHKGDFHHSLAAIVLEIDSDNEDIFHLRHIHGDDVTGAFYDLNHYYTSTEVMKVDRIAALITGDTHAEFIDDKVLEGTYTSANSIMNVLNPEVLVFHDLIDFYSRNHHHRGHDLITIGKHRYGRNNVEEGLQCGADFIDLVSKKDTLNVVVKSNHDEAFDRWLREAEPKNDPENAQFYHYMKYHQYKHVAMTNTGFTSIDPFEFWCKNPDLHRGLKNTGNTVFLARSQSFVVNDIELGLHGDIGIGGSRGSLRQFSKIGPKCVIGHSHSPGIHEGSYQVGVSAQLDLEYVKGQPSSWLHTHCLIYPDGKRTLINVINGKWSRN